MLSGLMVFAALVASLTNVAAQERRMVLSGEIVSPAFEGWWPNDDGTYTLFFGYMSSNWEQEFDIPVGPRNYFRIVEPGELDDLEADGYESDSALRMVFKPLPGVIKETGEVPPSLA